MFEIKRWERQIISLREQEYQSAA